MSIEHQVLSCIYEMDFLGKVIKNGLRDCDEVFDNVEHFREEYARGFNSIINLGSGYRKAYFMEQYSRAYELNKRLMEEFHK